MTEWIRLTEIESLRFTAWGTVALALVTGCLAVGAVWNVALLKRQTGNLEQQLQDARQQWLDSTKPIVTFQRCALLPGTEDSRFVEITLRNIGLGPAVDIVARAWVEPVPTGVLRDYGTKYGAWVEERIKNLDATGATMLEVRVMSIEKGQTAVAYLMDERKNILIDLDGADTAAVIVELRYRDIHDRTLTYPTPSGPGQIKNTNRTARIENRAPKRPGDV